VFALPPPSQVDNMTAVEFFPCRKEPYELVDIVLMRRTALRTARSLPVGPERNQKRQIAASLGALLKNDAWLNLYVKTVRTFRSAPLGVSRE
jgi:hypothetical protein